MRGIDAKSGETLKPGCRGNRRRPGACRDFRAGARPASSGARYPRKRTLVFLLMTKWCGLNFSWMAAMRYSS
jgi:hypothetical protein